MKKKIFCILFTIFLLSFTYNSCVCSDEIDDMFGIERMLSVTIYNESDKDVTIAWSMCDEGYSNVYVNKVSVESGKEMIRTFWGYPKWTSEDTISSGIASIEIAIEGESYKACGWPEGTEGFPDVSEYSDYGLCYVNHPITRDSLCYTQIGGTTTSYSVDTRKSSGISAVARIKSNDDGSLYIEWSLE